MVSELKKQALATTLKTLISRSLDVLTWLIHLLILPISLLLGSEDEPGRSR